MDVNALFTQLSFIVALAAGMALFMKLLRQPLIVGYILTGILVGPSVFNVVSSNSSFSILSQLGVSLLLFVVGLELSLKIITRLRRVVFVTTLLQVGVMTIVGASAAQLLDFGRLESLIIGLCISMSSTIIIVTLLQRKKEIMRLYAQIVVGILILQDLLATAGKITLSARTGGDNILEVALLLGRGLLFVVLLFVVSRTVFPRITKLLESSRELMLILSIGWALGIAVMCARIGFSIEVGALLAGMSLAGLPFSLGMATQLRPLRDFFIILFMIHLGYSLTTEQTEGVLPAVFVFSLLVLFIKPLVTLAILGAQGYTKRASFKAAVSMSQVSEFSLVFVAAAHQHYVGNAVLTAISLTALITFVVSPYLMKYDDWLFEKFEKHLRFFERRVTKLEQKPSMHVYPTVLFGYRKGGAEFIKTFKNMKQKFVVVDYDPDAIDLLEKQHIDYLYGDATDAEFIDELQLGKCKSVISTISDFAANEFLAHWLKQHNPGAVFIGSADNFSDAARLYSEGAAYVMMPHFIGSEKISSFIKRVGFKKSEFHKFRERHLQYLEAYHAQEIA